MPTVTFDLTHGPAATPWTGQLVIRSLKRAVASGVVALPGVTTLTLDTAGHGTATLTPGPYLIQEDGPGGEHRYVLVPDQAGAVAYGALVDVDPTTLDPRAQAEAAWWVALAAVQAGQVPTSAIESAVAAWLAEHPTETLTTEQVEQIITNLAGTTYASAADLAELETSVATKASATAVSEALTTLEQSIPTTAGDVGAVASPTSGTPSSSTFLRGDGVWAAPAGGAALTADATDPRVLVADVDLGLAAPVVTAQPSSISGAARGSLVTFTAAASGKPVPTCQWRRNGVNLTGKTDRSLRVFAQTTADNGSFDCVFTNSQGSAVSPAATLAVTPIAPRFTLSPIPASVTEGQSATFTVAVSGDPAPSVQWYTSIGGAPLAPISGATSTTYVTPALTLADNGRFYECRATSSAGQDNTGDVQVTVTAAPTATAPTIASQPVWVTIDEGATETLSVTANGTTPLSYQWRKSTDGVTYTDVSGATSASLVLANVLRGATGTTYRCRVTNSVGSVDSDPVAVSVIVADAIVTQPDSASTVAGSGVKFAAANHPGTAVTKAWQVSTDGGSTWAQQSTAATLTIASPQASDNGKKYRRKLTVGRADGSTVDVYSNTATLTVTTGTATAPVITQQPVNRTITADGGYGYTVFDCDATGFPTPSFQWQYYDGAAWQNVTSQTATQSSPLLVRETSYPTGTQLRCVITNASGSVTTSTVTLTIA